MRVLIRICICILFSLPFLQAQPEACPTDDCNCIGDLSEIQLYYFGDQPASIQVYSDEAQTNLLHDFVGITSGDLITISATGLPKDVFAFYTYFRITEAGEAPCTIRIYSQCPKNTWPGSFEDQQVIGKSYGDLTVFGYTSAGNGESCTVADVDQDWHVGGNIIAPDNRIFGTRNDQDISFITNDVERAVLTTQGRLGLGLNAPLAQLHLSSNARIDGDLDVFGLTRLQNNTNSSNATNGALVVSGGVGIGANLNVGANINVTGTAIVGNNLTVRPAGITRLESDAGSATPFTGALLVRGGVGIGQNLNVDDNFDVNGNATIGNDFTVESPGVARILNSTEAFSSNTGALVITGGIGIGRSVFINQDLTVGNLGRTALLSNLSSTSANNGALTVVGGVGIGGAVNIGQNLDVQGRAHIDDVVSISTTNTPGGHELYVGGSIIAEEVVVKLEGNWPDYVFDPDYPQPDLRDWAAHIAEHGHLPGLPSAAAVAQQDGVAVGAMQLQLLEKIEELTLILLQQQAEIDALRAQLDRQ